MNHARRLAPLVLLLMAALGWAIWSLTPPAVVGAGAPATAFSAARALQTVRLMATRPHPSGSPESAAVRRVLAARLAAMGLSVVTARQVGASVRGQDARTGRVETLVATLPGTDRTLRAVAIMAHTDSVPGSFGAADDGAGVAVAIEAIRAIAAGPRPARDVRLILTDGEEAGLLGARAVFADRAASARIGAIVNIDARGTSGLGTMFETGPASGGLVALYRAHARHRFAHSAATFLYHQLPNSTDLTAAEGRDIPALNFAFLDGEFDYHTPRDRLASLDPRTLQSLGDQILPVVRAVAASGVLPPRGADGVFGDSDGLVAIRYPAWGGWPLLLAATLLAGWAVRGAAPVGSIRAAAAMLWIAVAAALAARLGYGLTGVGDDWAEHHRIMAHMLRYEIALGLAALGCILAAGTLLRRPVQRWPVALAGLAAGVLALLLEQPFGATAGMALAAVLLATAAFGRPLGSREIQAGTLALGLLLALATQALAPPLTPLILWPVVVAALAAALARVTASRLLPAVVAIAPLAYIIVFGHSVLLALGVPTPEAIGLFAAIAAMLVLPLADRQPGWAASIMLAVAAGLLLLFRLDTPSERHPALSQLHGVVEPDGRSWRVSTLERPDRWTLAAIGQGAPVARADMPLLSADPVWRTPMPSPGIRPPAIRIARHGAVSAIMVTPGDGGRSIRLRVTLDRGATDVRVEGVALPGFLAMPGAWRLHWQSPGEPVTLTLRAPAGTQLSIDVAETSERGIALPPRPANVVPWLGSDRMILLATARAVL